MKKCPFNTDYDGNAECPFLNNGIVNGEFEHFCEHPKNWDKPCVLDLEKEIICSTLMVMDKR